MAKIIFLCITKVTELADLVLDSYRSQLASLPPGGEKREEVGRQMERDRDQLIGPLVDRKLYEEAASLAEKYLDFDALGNGRYLTSSIIGYGRSLTSSIIGNGRSFISSINALRH